MATKKKAAKKSTKKPSAAQLAARKKFAAMAKARTKKKAPAKRKTAKRKPATKAKAKKVARKVAVKTKAKAPTHYVVFAIVNGKKMYYDGAKRLGPKSGAMIYDKNELSMIARRLDKGLKQHEGIGYEVKK